MFAQAPSNESPSVELCGRFRSQIRVWSPNDTRSIACEMRTLQTDLRQFDAMAASVGEWEPLPTLEPPGDERDRDVASAEDEIAMQDERILACLVLPY